MSRRSPWAVLAVLTLVGALLAVSAVPATGKDGEADDLAIYSACVGPATESAAFEDVPARSVWEPAIDCMAYYGIIPGTSEDMFSPTVGVTRQQMALFLIRAAGPAGIDLPRPIDQDFEDIGGLPRSVRDAVNQLVELEITKGTSASTFSPDDIVTRRQMAQFLARFLDVAPVGEGGVDIDDLIPDDDQFVDIEDLPHGPYDAIRALFEMGITNGTSSTRFSPDRTVTRAQMAMFVSRMLAHTNARPAGITMQAELTEVTAGDTADLVVSVRDDDFQPVPDVSLDLFYAESVKVAFESNGTCTDEVVAEFGDLRCVIDLGDETTDGDGNLLYGMIVDETRVMWVWTGDRNDRFDVDRTDSASLEFTAVKPAIHFLLTDSMHPDAIKLPFGRQVTLTFQLVDEDERPVAEEDVAIRLRIREENDNKIRSDRTRTYDTDSSGRFQLSFRLRDPDSRDGDVDGLVDLYEVSGDLPVLDKSAVKVIESGTSLQWSDDEDEATTLLVEQSIAYHTATVSGRGGRNRVSATLLDQYGDPVRGVRVHFTSNDADGLSTHPDDPGSARNAYRKSTSSRGTATVTYYRDSDAPAIETISAYTEEVSADALDHYWVDSAPENATTTGEVLHHDADNNTIVIEPSSGGPYKVSYDTGDQFNDSSGGETFDDFEDGLDEGDTVTVVVDTHDRDDVNSFTRS